MKQNSPVHILHHGIIKKPGQMLALTFGCVTAYPSLITSENETPPYGNLPVFMAMENHRLNIRISLRNTADCEDRLHHTL